MSDELGSISQAANFWISQQSFNREQGWQPGSNVCNGITVNWTPRIWFTGLSLGSAAGSLIGIDTANCVAYFHLTGMVANFGETSLSMGCAIWFDCAPPFPAHSQSNVQYNGTLGFTLSINDLSGAIAPYDGHTVIPCAGYPVVACVLTGNSGHGGLRTAFAAGVASSLSLSDAISACGTAGINLCGATCDDINVVIVGLS